VLSSHDLCLMDSWLSAERLAHGEKAATMTDDQLKSV
jgi:hypothetical protein